MSLTGTIKYLSGSEPCRFLEEEHSRQREQQIERPRGRTVANVWEEQQGGLCGYSGLRERGEPREVSEDRGVRGM